MVLQGIFQRGLRLSTHVSTPGCVHCPSPRHLSALPHHLSVLSRQLSRPAQRQLSWQCPPWLSSPSSSSSPRLPPPCTCLHGGLQDTLTAGRLPQQDMPTAGSVPRQSGAGVRHLSTTAPSPLRAVRDFREGQGGARYGAQEPDRRRQLAGYDRVAPRDDLHFFATCAPGFENVLADELRAPAMGADLIEVGAAGVSFRGTWRTGYTANLWLRSATRVLVQLAVGNLSSMRPAGDTLYEFIRGAVDWRGLLERDGERAEWGDRRQGRGWEGERGQGRGWEGERGLGDRAAEARRRFRTFSVDSRVWDCSTLTNKNFASVCTKDAVCDALRDACGGLRPEPPGPGREADVPLFLSVFRDRARLYRDMSGRPLHKRGYRPPVIHRASLNESVAAGILLMTGLRQGQSQGGAEQVIMDPMCGSGTLLIEAALILANRAPGLLRNSWPFESWPDFNEPLWRRCLSDARSTALPLPSVPARLLGNDAHAGALDLCAQAAAAAGVAELLALRCGRCQDWEPAAVPSLVVVNPPWGGRLGGSESLEDGEESLEETWGSLGRFLKNRCGGAQAYILSGNPTISKELRLKAKSKHAFFCGGTECRLLHYDILPTRLPSVASAPSA